jgi:hypothetical protein
MTSALRFPWTQSMELLIFILFSTFLLLSSPCHAYSKSDLGSQCTEVEYQANLSDLLNSLVANAPIQNGFYMTAAGKGANKIYGLTQCRGDISATDCAACIKNVTVLQGCSNSKGVTLWFQWCLVRYSDRSFFGEWDQSGIMAIYNDTNFEDAEVVSEGLNCWAISRTQSHTIYVVRQLAYSTELLVCINEAYKQYKQRRRR